MQCLHSLEIIINFAVINNHARAAAFGAGMAHAVGLSCAPCLLGLTAMCL